MRRGSGLLRDKIDLTDEKARSNPSDAYRIGRSAPSVRGRSNYQLITLPDDNVPREAALFSALAQINHGGKSRLRSNGNPGSVGAPD